MLDKEQTLFEQTCKQIRCNRNMTLHEFSQRLGYSSAYVKNLEAGRISTKYRHIKAMVKYIGLTEDEYLELTKAWVLSQPKITIDTRDLTDKDKLSFLSYLNQIV